MSLLAAVTLHPSTFPPLAVGFMGLGTGYLIYGPQELFGYPKRSKEVDWPTGLWGIALPGFLQFFTGAYIFLGLVLGTFTAKPLYMAGLAFTAYGVHWFVIGWNRLHGADGRASLGMTVGFLLISILGIIVFFGAHDDPVGGLFIGLTGVYVSDVFATVKADLPERLETPPLRSLGFFHLGTGLWLIYLMFAVALNFVLAYNLPL
ncbi:MAG: hypothetical protein M0010_16225 [Actinomycetota bacterium]|nr:hypothetical protein [Actinomycetota bacterium]